MSEHRVIIEAGPGTIRRLCCGASTIADDELSDTVRSALAAIDDQVALVGEQPVAVDSLWDAALRSATCASSADMVVVHPSWWSSSRVGVVTAAAARVAGDVQAHKRSWLLMRASRAGPGPGGGRERAADRGARDHPGADHAAGGGGRVLLPGRRCRIAVRRARVGFMATLVKPTILQR